MIYVLYPDKDVDSSAKIKNSDVALAFETFLAWDDASAQARADKELRDRRNLARKTVTARANESPAWVSANKIARKHKSLDSGVSASVAAYRREALTAKRLQVRHQCCVCILLQTAS